MTRREIVLALSILSVLLPPLLPGPLALDSAVWAKDGRDGGKDRDSDNSGPGSENSGRDNDRDDRDDRDDERDDDSDDRDDDKDQGDDRDDSDDDNSGKGSGTGSSGSGSSGSGSAGGGGAPGGKSSAAKPAPGPGGASERDPFGAAGLHVFLADGGREVLRNGTYLRLDRAGKVTERREATARDRKRLTALSRSLRAQGQGPATGVAVVERRRVELRDDHGWVEILDGNRYELIDPNGNIVTRRRATSRDLLRVRQQLGL